MHADAMWKTGLSLVRLSEERVTTLFLLWCDQTARMLLITLPSYRKLGRMMLVSVGRDLSFLWGTPARWHCLGLVVPEDELKTRR